MGWDVKMSLEERKKWGEEILQHSFDENEWQQARSTLLNLLASENLHAEENSIRSYISCCAEAVGSSYPLPSLEKTVIEFFQEHGMDNATSA